MAKILLLDDEPRLLKTVGRLLEREGHHVSAGTSLAAVDEEMHPGRFDLLITDILMPEHSGLDVLRRAVARGCAEPVVLITGEPNVESASEAVRNGAFDYLPKPVTKDKLKKVVQRALRHIELVRERDRARQNELQLLRSLAVIGESAAVLAHEIKTPLSNLNVALHAVADALDVEQKTVLEGLVDRLERIQTLMRRTLSFARPLDLHLAPLDPGELVREVASGFSRLPDHDQFAIEVRTDGLPAVVADRQLLEEVLNNLIQNAADACARRGRLLVSCDASGPGGVRILVDDDGPGIPAEDRSDLFKLFHSTKKSGTGIGLAFCRKVIDAHGGRLALVNSELGGACFEIDLQSNPDGKRP